ncbi:MAG: ParB/RepB/Spo0J family partition protein [Phycisphaerales bacterium JB041]
MAQPTSKPRRLGLGLSSRFQPAEPVRVDADQTYTEQTDEPSGGQGTAPAERADGAAVGESGGLVRWVAIERVERSPFQPRRHFDDAALEQLAASIRRSGLMQPIIVRPVAAGFELVAGERRWRAAAAAGLEKVPAVVRELSDEEAAEWALVENLQREELNPIERAHGLKSLADRFGVSHAELGERLGLDRSTVANLIRLTDLEPEIQDEVATGKLSMGHARALLGVPASGARLALAKRAIAGSWSVRQTEENVRRTTQDAQAKPVSTPGELPNQRAAVIADLERRLSAHLGTKASVTMRGRGNRGRLVIEFYSLEEFEGLMERVGLTDE